MWTQTETQLLIDLCRGYKHKEMDWTVIATIIGRTQKACKQKYQRVRFNSGPWTQEEEQRFAWCIDNMSTMNTIDWKAIGRYMQTRSIDQCRKKWRRMNANKQTKKRVSFTDEECIFFQRHGLKAAQQKYPHHSRGSWISYSRRIDRDQQDTT